MVTCVRSPFAYPFLRPYPQKRVRVYTNGSCCMHADTPFRDGDTRGVPISANPCCNKQGCVPISAAQHAETGTPRHETGPQKQVRFPFTPTPPLAETGTLSIGGRQPSLWVISLFSRRNRYGTWRQALRHSAQAALPEAFSDESWQTRERSISIPVSAALLGGLAESGTLEISPCLIEAGACFHPNPILVGTPFSDSLNVTQIWVRLAHKIARPAPQKRVRLARSHGAERFR